MTSKRIAQTNQQQKSENPQASGILQRPAVRSVADAGVQFEEQEAQPHSKSAFSKDFSRVPISRNKPQPIQAKLTIGEPGDKYEQEADRVASQVVQQINTPSAAQSTQRKSLQRQDAAAEEIQTKPSISVLQRSPLPTQLQLEVKPEDEELQAKSIIQGRDARGAGEASTDVESTINSARGGGMPLDAGLQRSMGQAMGADFSGVKVHTDSQADHLNQSIQARAFTTGQDVFFRQGEYNPGSRGGQELLAHELTHVVQQNGGATQPAATIQCQLDKEELLKKLQGLKKDQLSEALDDQLATKGIKANAPNAHRHSPDIFEKLNELQKELDTLFKAGKHNREWHETFQSKLEEYIKFYNEEEAALKEAEKTHAPRYNLENEVKFGTEFTFTREDIKDLTTDNKNSESMKIAESLIESWAGKIKTHNGKPVDKKTPPTEGNLQPKSKKSIQFIYNLKQGGKWWWALDIDNGCLETQTKPMTYEDASGEIKTIIDKHIFALAGQMKLRADDLIGSGHITLDASTTFKDDARTLRNFLVSYHSDFEKWSKYDKDASNAPMMEELSEDVRIEFKAVIDEVDRKILSQKTPGKGKGKQEAEMTQTELVDKLLKVFRLKKAYVTGWENEIDSLKGKRKKGKGKDTEPTLAENVRDNRAHYQALNLENMNKEAGTNRLEMRRFAAQENSEKLEEEMKEILDLIHKSRQKDLIKLPNDFATKAQVKVSINLL
ncbi:eCIS core domain-containing protein [Nostoc sp.]|uniref:eCIS core domain-containing protein n=1 Tax=Nostoc sp. TaxID=1180 RepID=UPI002FFA88E3